MLPHARCQYFIISTSVSAKATLIRASPVVVYYNGIMFNMLCAISVHATRMNDSKKPEEFLMSGFE
jgi:hypothetical protein